MSNIVSLEHQRKRLAAAAIDEVGAPDIGVPAQPGLVARLKQELRDTLAHPDTVLTLEDRPLYNLNASEIAGRLLSASEIADAIKRDNDADEDAHWDDGSDVLRGKVDVVASRVAEEVVEPMEES